MKNIAVMVTGTYQLLQAIWFYTQHPECEYTAFIKTANLPDGVKEKLKEYCGTCGIFKKVCVTDGIAYDASFSQKVKLSLKMFFYFITGRKKKLVKKIIQEQMNLNDYDTILADSEISILGGAFINCAQEKRVIIMQEGLYDLQSRRKLPKLGLNDLVGYFIAKMGYCNPMQLYTLKNTIYCEKLLSHPELTIYKKFKSIIKLFDMSAEQKKEFDKIVHRTFPKIEWSNIVEADVVLFTSEFSYFTDEEKYYEIMYHWIKENIADKKIVIKKHPRDKYSYEWNDLDISFVDESLPAEIIVSQISNQKILFMYFSTCILGALDTSCDYTVFYFSCIQNKKYSDIFYELQRRLHVGEQDVINLC